MVAFHLSVVGSVHYDGVIGQALFLERVVDMADARVNKCEAAHVAGAVCPLAFFPQRSCTFNALLDVPRILRDVTNLRKLHLVDGIFLRPLPRRVKRRMRFHKTDEKKKRLPAVSGYELRRLAS